MTLFLFRSLELVIVASQPQGPTMQLDGIISRKLFAALAKISFVEYSAGDCSADDYQRCAVHA